MKIFCQYVSAPAEVGNALVGIHGRSELSVGLRLEAVHKGFWYRVLIPQTLRGNLADITRLLSTTLW